MRPLADQLANYAAYHRDGRNIALHFIGIPLIVLAVEILLSRASFSIGTFSVTAAMIASALAAFFYFRLDLRLGVAMAVLLALGAWAGAFVANQSHSLWLGAGIGLFVLGWAFQFVGHFYEGRKPAFLDDLMGLLIGPLFVVAEIAFAIGWRSDLERAITAAAGAKKKGRDRSRPSSL
jgi:uncharacterized membrane protein YGL010W